MSQPAPPPKPLPRNLHPPRARPPFAAIGGKIGLAIFVMTALAVLYFGWVAWQKFGPAVSKVFATNDSSSYPTRLDFFESRIREVERADSKRKFAFTSPSTGSNKLKVYLEGEDLVLDASDAKENPQALSTAKEMMEFMAAGASPQRLEIRYRAPRDAKQIAAVAAAIFEKILDGAPEGMRDLEGKRLADIHFNDLE